MESDDQYLHPIAENSCFFQGHKGQFFTKDGISFRITKNTHDEEELEKINISRYRRTLFRSLRAKIVERKKAGGTMPIPRDNDILIRHIKLVNNSKDDGICGFHQIYPNTAICIESNCNQYFDLSKGKTCGHPQDSRWDQINFVAFCDVCGRVVPFQYASSLGNDCKFCFGKYSLRILSWTKKDDFTTYKVKCNKCHRKTGLFFLYCNHFDKVNNITLSSKEEKKRYRGVPSRAGSVIHPVVLTIPDVLDYQEGASLNDRKSASEAFCHFFPDYEESIFEAPELRNVLIYDTEFWKQRAVAFLAQGKSISPDSLKTSEDNSKLKKFLRILIKVAKDMDSAEEHNTVLTEYGISNLVTAMGKIPIKTNLDEEWEGIFLVSQEDSPMEFSRDGESDMKEYGNIHSYTIRSRPYSSPEEQYNSWLKSKSLTKISHIGGLNMIQALLGVIEGSTRNTMPLFNVILTGKKTQQKPTIFVRAFITEGIVFQLDHKKILYWFEANQNLISPTEEMHWDKTKNPSTEYQDIIETNIHFKNAAYKLLHTYSHMLMQESTIHTGLDIRSLSEKIYPGVACVFLFSTNNLNVGGLESIFDSNLNNWFERMYDLAADCPQDPSCAIDEGGACNACSFVPEFVCENFNQDLDRSTLIGKSKRFSTGFFDVYKSSG